MALPSAQDVAAKWASRAGAASTDYVQGAERTDKDPTALAINALPRAKQQYIAAIDSGKVAAGLRRAGKTGWLEGIRSSQPVLPARRSPAATLPESIAAMYCCLARGSALIASAVGSLSVRSAPCT